MSTVNDCPFCQAGRRKEIIVEYGSAFAILDRYQVTQGHHLVMNKRHLSDYFGMSFNEKRDAEARCWRFCGNRSSPKIPA